jgi:hypothetical protein
VTNRPKAIGTAAETAVCTYVRENGFGNAERRALRGGKDCGDLTGLGPLVVEIKGGEQARKASDNRIKEWLVETETERANAGADLGLLVVARTRQNVRNWWTVMTVGTYCKILPGGYPTVQEPLNSLSCRTTLESAVIMLRANGWGDPLD